MNAGDEWPSSALAIFVSTPSSSRIVANACLQSCKRIFGGRPARWRVPAQCEFSFNGRFERSELLLRQQETAETRKSTYGGSPSSLLERARGFFGPELHQLASRFTMACASNCGATDRLNRSKARPNAMILLNAIICSRGLRPLPLQRTFLAVITAWSFFAPHDSGDFFTTLTLMIS